MTKPTIFRCAVCGKVIRAPVGVQQAFADFTERGMKVPLVCSLACSKKYERKGR